MQDQDSAKIIPMKKPCSCGRPDCTRLAQIKTSGLSFACAKWVANQQRKADGIPVEIRVPIGRENADLYKWIKQEAQQNYLSVCTQALKLLELAKNNKGITLDDFAMVLMGRLILEEELICELRELRKRIRCYEPIE